LAGRWCRTVTAWCRWAGGVVGWASIVAKAHGAKVGTARPLHLAQDITKAWLSISKGAGHKLVTRPGARLRWWQSRGRRGRGHWRRGENSQPCAGMCVPIGPTTPIGSGHVDKKHHGRAWWRKRRIAQVHHNVQMTCILVQGVLLLYLQRISEFQFGNHEDFAIHRICERKGASQLLGIGLERGGLGCERQDSAPWVYFGGRGRCHCHVGGLARRGHGAW
jgi:hypothetical protein